MRHASRWLPLLLLVAFVATAWGADPRSLEGVVVKVVDGDTIHVRLGGRIEKVRYIGVDTPELRHPTQGQQPGSREARDVNRHLVDGRQVRLELDVGERDRYGRLLAYVWVGQTMVNAELVGQGYAQVMTVPPNLRYQQLFLRLQRDARQSGRGLWRGASRGQTPHIALLGSDPALARGLTPWRGVSRGLTPLFHFGGPVVL